ncbi:MAG TPA: response regulator transcription factor [Thermodesulfobacteriota bacterium]|nr:response regulator transcription factor [Thermodesulfobacteriota bacterium]HOC38543.1 response regulator transcription factor [Thermodesulfobacteriota bacterium]
MISTLLIDNDLSFREAFRDGLLALIPDLHIEEVADGQSARSIIDQNRPDVIIVDLFLPAENGLSLTRWIKEHNPSTKVIILSTSSMPTHMVEAAQAGAECFITKGSLTLTEIGKLIHALMAL